MYEKNEHRREKFSFLTKIFRSFFWLIVLISSLGLALYAFKDIQGISKYYNDNETFKNLYSRENLVILVSMLTVGLSFVSSLSRKYFITKIIALVITLAISTVIITIVSSSNLSKDTIFSFVFEASKNQDIKELSEAVKLFANLQEKLVISIPLIYILIFTIYASIANGARRIRISNIIMGVAIVISIILTLTIIVGAYSEKDSKVYEHIQATIKHVKPAVFTLLTISGFMGLFTVFSRDNK